MFGCGLCLIWSPGGSSTVQESPSGGHWPTLSEPTIAEGGVPGGRWKAMCLSFVFRSQWFQEGSLEDIMQTHGGPHLETRRVVCPKAVSCPVLSSALAPAPSVVARHIGIINTCLLNEINLNQNPAQG